MQEPAEREQEADSAGRRRELAWLAAAVQVVADLEALALAEVLVLEGQEVQAHRVVQAHREALLGQHRPDLQVRRRKAQYKDPREQRCPVQVPWRGRGMCRRRVQVAAG